jgi:hypothetical protein
MNACRNVCGPTFLARPALRATRRTIRAAPCRSSRRPAAVTKIGLSQRSPMARSIARGSRRQRDHRVLASLADDRQRAVAAFGAERLDIGAGGFGDPQPVAV